MLLTVVLQKTLESPLDSKEIQPVHPKGDQSWVFIGRTDAEAETPILWLPHAKSWLIGKDPDAGRVWGQEEKGMTEDEMALMASLTQCTWVWVNSGSWWWTGKPGMLQFMGSQRVRHDWVTDLICWRRLLRVPWTARRSKQSILKEISLACSLERLLKLKLQYFGQLMWRPDSFEKTLMLGKIEGRRRRGRERIRWLHGITDSMDICLGGLQELVIDREAWPAAVHVITKILTQLSDWTWLNWWDWRPWPLFFECWVLSQLFHSLLSLLAEGCLVPLCFLP